MKLPEALALSAFMLTVGVACLATHSADPLWLLVFLIFFFMDY